MRQRCIQHFVEHLARSSYDPTEALATIRSYAVARRIAYTTHAQQRIGTAQRQPRDVASALSNARTCRPGATADWVACGPDLDGDDLDVAVSIEAGLIVVTVF